MGIEIGQATRAEWDRCIGQSSHATVFHQSAMLDLLADLADAYLHLLVGYKGEQPVGLLPSSRPGVDPSPNSARRRSRSR